MDRVPLEVVIRHASEEVGRYFADQVERERKNGKVAILVEDFTNSLFFMPCNKLGYPDFHQFNFMTYDSLSVTVLNEGQYTPSEISRTVEEVSVMIERPLLSQRFDWQEPPYIFLWRGRKTSSKKIPLEKLNVSELMKLAQEVVKKRAVFSFQRISTLSTTSRGVGSVSHIGFVGAISTIS